MSYDPGALDAALAAAVGDDPVLIVDLRHAFLESAQRQIALLERARCDANWQIAAWRLKGLAASFGVVGLMSLSDRKSTPELQSLMRISYAVFCLNKKKHLTKIQHT